MRCSPKLVAILPFSAFVLSLDLATPASAQQILEVYTGSFTYKPGSATAVQGVKPLVLQRGVNLDGSLRSRPNLNMALQGNPFEDVWVGGQSQGSLRIDIGAWAPSEVDIALPCKGRAGWVIGRNYNPVQASDSDGYQGVNWTQSSQPEIVFYNDADDSKDLVYLVFGADRYIEAQRVMSGASPTNQYKTKNGAAGVFDYQSGSPDLWVYHDQVGTKFTFIGFNTGSHLQDGVLWKIEDEEGTPNVSFVGDSSSASTALGSNVGWDSAGRILTAYDSSDRRYTYSYTSINGTTRLTQVKAETHSGGTWASSPTGIVEVARVDYDYYGAAVNYGTSGDLKKVVITTPLSDSGVSQAKEKYYRYWKGTYNSSTNAGYPHQLQYVFDFEGFRRWDLDDNAALDESVFSVSSGFESYAAAYFEYDSSRRVRTAFFNGECGCTGGSNGTYNYSYDATTPAGTPGYHSTWLTRTIVTRPDSTYLTQEFDEQGQPLDRMVTDVTPASWTKLWATTVTRDSKGIVTDINTPANVTSYTHSGGTKSKSNSAGKVSTILRTPSGDLTGFRTDRQYEEGSSGTAYYEETVTYTTLAETVGSTSVVRPLIDSRTQYTENDDNGSGPSNVVTYGYTSYASTLQVEDLTITDPTVTTGNNGSNSATVAYRHYKRDGTIDFQRSRDDRITFYAYTNGQETTRIEDADTGSGDFSGITVYTSPVDYSTIGSGPLHKKTITEYDPQGRRRKVTSSFGASAAYNTAVSYYSKLADERAVRLDYADYKASPETFYGPVRYTVMNQAGKSELAGRIALGGNASTAAQTTHIDETDADPITAVDTGSSFGAVAQMRTSIYSNSGTELDEERNYFVIPGSGVGTDSSNYDPTKYGYDTMGRRWRVKEASGTIRRTVFDTLGRQTQMWIGTNDHTFTGGESVNADNMVETEIRAYDLGSSKGNSLLTSLTLRVEGSSTDERVTTYDYDYRGRLLLQTNPTAPHAFHKYDNLGRRIATGLFSSTGSITLPTDDPTTETANRMALNETLYDELGRAWKTIRHEIDDADGSDDDTLESLTWYDATGRVIEVRGEEYKKTAYDRLGRKTDEYVLAKDNDSTYADADDVSGDIVLEQYETRYSTTTRDVLMQITLQRKHNDISGGETTGALDTNADGGSPSALKLSSADAKGRPQITAFWYDQFGRRTDIVRYGTYGGSDFDRVGLSVPSRSDTELRSTTAYNTDGTVDTVTDPRGLVQKFVYDAQGRRTKEIKNYDSGVNSGDPYGTADNVSVLYGYAKGLRTSLTADLPSGLTDQVTTYIYGTTAGTPSAMMISTGHLLRAVKYPDSTNPGSTQLYIDGTSDADVVSYAYNAQGQETSRKDQAGNVLDSTYDTSGHRTKQTASTVASGFDSAVLRVETAFDSLGRPSSIVQYDATTSGSATDGIAYTYDDWGNISVYEEDRNGAVASDQYTTSYTWTKNAPTYGRYTLRKTGMVMPGGRTLSYTFRSAGGLHDDEASRVSTIVDSGPGTICQYDYLGVGTVVRTKYNEITCMSRVYDDSGAIVDLDQFNRITTSRWTKDLSTDEDFYQVALTYDRDSTITSAEDNVHTGFDVKYTMDSVNRLTEAQEGTLSTGSITSQTRDEQWTLSHTGNWDREKLNLNGDGDFTDSGEHDDTRTHNAVNELTARDTDSNSSNNYTLTYDAAGNMTDDGENYKYEYDAWNRLRKVKQTGNSALVAEYRYNGLNHRIGVHEDTDTDNDVDGNDKWFYDAFDERWRMLARFRESDSYPKEDFVLHQAGASGRGGSSYIDLVVDRNRDESSSWTSSSDGVLEARIYYCQNWRADVSALVTYGGVLKEWVKYSAYGTPIGLPAGDTDSDGDCDGTDVSTVGGHCASSCDVRWDLNLDGVVNGSDDTLVSAMSGTTLGRGVLSATAVASRRGYAGYEALSGLMGGKWLGRSRSLSGDLGRWLSRDSSGYSEGLSLTQFTMSNPCARIDPDGRESYSCVMPGPGSGGGSSGSSGGPQASQVPGSARQGGHHQSHGGLWVSEYFPPIEGTPDVCARAAQRWPGHSGYTFCNDGIATYCIYFDGNAAGGGAASHDAACATEGCLREHEKVHANSIVCNPGVGMDGPAQDNLGASAEIVATTAQIGCLENAKNNPPGTYNDGGEEYRNELDAQMKYTEMLMFVNTFF